ncbi:hypothetical protein [Pseudofulvibacter geojedonensis]|uniref:Uncharacterized protein n=1 Tax=Pseudofulvibacter geojedonensis TaxID=1123758 RepID=A0ABW3I3P7_9FLAO
MEKTIKIKSDYKSLNDLQKKLVQSSTLECSKEYDVWEQRVDVNGQMAECIVLRKSNMHAIKMFFVNENTIKINHIIPNKIMNVYFGKSVKIRRNIIEVLTEMIKQKLLATSQENAFNELTMIVNKAVAKAY